MRAELHNHGPNDGPGINCRERRQRDGIIKGACMTNQVVVRKWVALDNKRDTVEAIKMTRKNAERVAEWCGGELVYEDGKEPSDDTFLGVKIIDKHYNAVAREGDYIVKDPVGFWASDHSYFTHTFRRLGDRVATPS